MNLASILQLPIEDTHQTPTPTRHSSELSTSTSPILSPHAGCGVVKSKSTKRTQTKAACLGCRRRKSKVGDLVESCMRSGPSVLTLYPLKNSATETVRHANCASKGVPNASIPSKKARRNNKQQKNNSDHTKTSCRCCGIARPRRAKPSCTSSKTWTSTMLADSSLTDQSLYRVSEQVNCSP